MRSVLRVLETHEDSRCPGNCVGRINPQRSGGSRARLVALTQLCVRRGKPKVHVSEVCRARNTFAEGLQCLLVFFAQVVCQSQKCGRHGQVKRVKTHVSPERRDGPVEFTCEHQDSTEM